VSIIRPTDDLHVTFPTEKGPVHRHWSADQPRASVSVSLRANILASGSTAFDEIARAVLLQDEDVKAGIARDEVDEEAGKRAMLLFRNARAGRAIRGALSFDGVGGDVELITQSREGTEVPRLKPGPQMTAATEYLDQLAQWIVQRHGGHLDKDALFGVTEFGVLKRPGLLTELCYASNLRLRGDSWNTSGEALTRAHAEGLESWRNALDDLLVSADEFQLLAMFCLIHAFRPF
jgi:hypothetical protein